MRTQAPAGSSPATSPAPATRPATRWARVLAVDVALVLAFAAAGRNAHALGATGLLGTAWPFLAGLLTGWAAWRVAAAPVALWPHGVALWLTTVVVGMALRVAAGGGAAPAFVLVGLGVLGALLLGHRVLSRLLAGVLARRRAAGHPHRCAA